MKPNCLFQLIDLEFEDRFKIGIYKPIQYKPDSRLGSAPQFGVLEPRRIKEVAEHLL